MIVVGTTHHKHVNDFRVVLWRVKALYAGMHKAAECSAFFA